MDVNGTLTLNSTVINGTLQVNGQIVNGQININNPQINATYGGTGTVPPSVLAHIDRVDNPHQVQAGQLPTGDNLTLLFENALL